MEQSKYKPHICGIKEIFMDFSLSEAFRLWLIKKRKQNNLTQQILAELSNINEKHYGRVERGENGVTLAFIEKVCDGLGIKYRDLFIELEEEIKNMGNL
jgi:transcriptional regulator with XRE-family HTH domain